MTWVIGRGNSFIFRQGGGTSWQTYWATRNPSGLALTVISDTEIDGSFTINGTGQDGHKIYISTDNITFTLLDTLTGTDNTFQATELTKGQAYYFLVKAYKGDNLSDGTDAEAIYDWMWYPYFAFPDYGLNLIVGNSGTIYGNSLINVPITNNLTVEYTCDIGSASGNDYTITPVTADIGYHSLAMTFKNDGNTFYTKTIYLTVIEQVALGSKKILMIGDSTLDGDLNYTAPRINAVLDEETITYLGTQGTTYKHEGYPGWKFSDFATSASSPFVNGGVIDIANYFTANSIAVPDIVYFRLGINEMYSQCNGELTDAEIETILGYADNLIDGFLAYNANLKVIVALPSLCDDDGVGWAASYDEEVYLQDAYIEYMHRFWVKIVERYAGGVYSRRVDCSYEVIHLDRDLGYYMEDGVHASGVHLSQLGDQQLGYGFAAYLNKTNPEYLILTSAGTGDGVATMRLNVTADITVTLTGGAKFYSDAGGTLDESDTWTVTAGALRTIYLKCTSGTSYMTFSDVTKVIWFGQPATSSNYGWVVPVNGPVLTGDISIFVNIIYIAITDAYNAVTGNITNLSLARIRIFGSNHIYGDISDKTALTYLYLYGANRVWGDLGKNNVCDGITLLGLLACAMKEYTAGGTWEDASVLTINPSSGFGLSATEIDNMLIDMANSGTISGKTITLQGSNSPRTSASDAAVVTLEAAGNTLVLNT